MLQHSVINQSGHGVLECGQKRRFQIECPRVIFLRDSLRSATAHLSVVVIVVILVSPGNGFQFFIDPVAIK